MEYIYILDDDIDFTASKWMLESALNCGCDTFSVEVKYKNRLLDLLEPYSKGTRNLEKLVNYIPKPKTYFQNCWEFSRETADIVLSNMGRHLLDFDKAANSGILNWQFYCGDRLIAGAAYENDYFIFYEPPKILLEVLENKNIPIYRGEEK